MGKLSKERGNSFFRTLDRYVGIFLLYFFSLFKTSKNSKKVNGSGDTAFIKLGAIGDSILTIPIISAFRKKYPNARLTVICGRNNVAVYQNLLHNHIIDNLIEIDFNRFISDWRYSYQKSQKLKEETYDYCIDFDSWYRISALISLWITADYKIGFKTAHQHKHVLFDHCIDHKNTCHEFENYSRLVALLVGRVKEWPDYPLTKAAGDFYQDFKTYHELDTYVVLHPWASGYKNSRKELSFNDMVYIGNTLAEQGFSIIITGGGNDVDASKKLAALINGSISIAGRTNLNETAVFLKNAACVVTVNTGILHMAAAVDANIVSINGPTNIDRWGPLSDKAVNITSRLSCSPCLNLGFEYKCRQNDVPPGHCMQKIDLDEVVRSAIKLLKMPDENMSIKP